MTFRTHKIFHDDGIIASIFWPDLFFLHAAAAEHSSIAIRGGGRVLWVNSKGQSPVEGGHLSSNKICLLILKVVVWHETSLHTRIEHTTSYRVP